MFGFIYIILGIFFVDPILCLSNGIPDTSDTTDYCNHPDCSLKKQHTLCLAAKRRSPRVFVSGLTPWMRYQLLLLHNRHRDNIALGLELGQPPAANMRKMYWDYELEHMAEAWARQCQKRHDECRNTIRFNVLQNMDVRPVVPKMTEAQLLSDAVGAWFSGSRTMPPENIWSFKQSNCSGVSGCNDHWYSAAAWGSTWRLGCSQSLCTVKKNSCTIYRKKRRMELIVNGPDEEMINRTESVTSNLLLRRTRYMRTTRAARIEDYATADKPRGNESPIHRGVFEEARSEKPQELELIAFTVCNYGPAGNIDGFPMYEAGQPCDDCPEATRCGDKTHRALCALVGDPETGHA
ncbi:cysteine-rich secretory protein family domain-containing protein [Phthorimaea operculella]|nr:cysteine-rich secretory protein family domain-containing protein [Phthorimaea operculella]